jgi:hypothetical protein
MGFGIQTKVKKMITLKKVKLIHVGRYAAEVAVELIDDDTGWAPYLTVEDARKLDRVRELLHYERIDEALKYGPVFELQPCPRPEKR